MSGWHMQAAMNKMGNKLPEAELQQLMLNADVDGDGSINYEEFVAATVNLNKLEKEEHFVQVCHAAGPDNGHALADACQVGIKFHVAVPALETATAGQSCCTSKSLQCNGEKACSCVLALLPPGCISRCDV